MMAKVSQRYSQISNVSAGARQPQFSKVIDFPEDTDDIYQQTYDDFQWYLQDLYQQSQWELEFAITREQCTNACNDITDMAWITCGAFTLLAVGGPGGALLGGGAAVICMAYYYDRRAECRARCLR